MILWDIARFNFNYKIKKLQLQESCSFEKIHVRLYKLKPCRLKPQVWYIIGFNYKEKYKSQLQLWEIKLGDNVKSKLWEKYYLQSREIKLQFQKKSQLWEIMLQLQEISS